METSYFCALWVYEISSATRKCTLLRIATLFFFQGDPTDPSPWFVDSSVCAVSLTCASYKQRETCCCCSYKSAPHGSVVKVSWNKYHPQSVKHMPCLQWCRHCPSFSGNNTWIQYGHLLCTLLNGWHPWLFWFASNHLRLIIGQESLLPTCILIDQRKYFSITKSTLSWKRINILFLIQY